MEHVFICPAYAVVVEQMNIISELTFCKTRELHQHFYGKYVVYFTQDWNALSSKLLIVIRFLPRNISEIIRP